MKKYGSRWHRLMYRLGALLRARKAFWDPETLSWAAANEVGRIRPEREK